MTCDGCEVTEFARSHEHRFANGLHILMLAVDLEDWDNTRKAVLMLRGVLDDLRRGRDTFGYARA